MYLSLLSFVLVSTTAISLNSGFDNIVTYIYPLKKSKAYSDLPVLKDTAKYPILSAQSVMAVDLVSGVTLYEKIQTKHFFLPQQQK